MFADGSGSTKYLIDLSAQLSKRYGKLIRQGQIFKVKSIQARIFNPNTLVQDVLMSCSGNYLFMNPTGNRKKAWLSGFKACQANRKLLFGTAPKRSGYDFRIGLAPGYSSNPDGYSSGVAFNAWIQDEDKIMYLAGDSDTGVMDVYNQQMDLTTAKYPSNPEDGFGTWAHHDTQEMDFVQNEEHFFNWDEASADFDHAPFQLAFSSIYDSAGDAQDSLGTVTNTDTTEDLTVMCGLIGIHIDTTGSDDTVSQTQEMGLELIVDVESWSPIIKSGRRRKSRKSRKGRKK